MNCRQHEGWSDRAANDLNRLQYEARFRPSRTTKKGASWTTLPHGVTHNLPYPRPEASARVFPRAIPRCAPDL